MLLRLANLTENNFDVSFSGNQNLIHDPLCFAVLSKYSRRVQKTQDVRDVATNTRSY